MFARDVLCAAVIMAIILTGCKKTDGQATTQDQTEETTMSEQFQYGFRYDPVEVVASDGSLDASLVRTLLLKTPYPGDAAEVEAHFAKVIGAQNDDGSLKDEDDRPPLEATALKLRRLLQEGYSPKRPQMQRAIAFVEKALAELPEADWPEAPGDAVHVMCLLGKTDRPVIKVRLEALAEKMPELWGGGCPGTPFAQLVDLWAGRDVADVNSAIESTLVWADEAIAAPGCSSKLALCSSWTMIEVLGEIDHPTATRLARRLVPMLLRAQQADGHWREGHGGDKTFFVLRMLSVHGLLDELRDLPPLPADWRIVRALPLPGGRAMNICALDGHLWVLDMAGPAIIEISPTDGAVIKTLEFGPVPGLNAFTLAAGDGVFYVSAFGHKDERPDLRRPDAIHEIDAATGKVLRKFDMTRTGDITGATRVGRELLACDGWGGGVWVVDLDNPDAELTQTFDRVAAGMPDYLASDGETIWAVEFMAPSLVKSTSDGKLLDWTERPFGLNPVAWDGKNLWAFDSDNNRICLIERASADEAPSIELTRQLIQAEPTFDIPNLDGAARRQAFAVNLLSPISQPQDTDDFDAQFTLGWSDDALLVGARIHDDDFVAAKDLKKLWGNQADCVLVYVKAPDGEMLRVVVEPGMTDDQPEPRIMHEPHTNRTREATVQRRKLDDGYALQISLPWDLIGIEPAEGKDLRVQLIALDVDAAGEDMEMHGLMWYPATGTPENPMISYRVSLAQQASPAATALVTPVKNAHGLIDSIRVAARAERVGQTVTIAGNGAVSGETALTIDRAGMAVAWIPLPAGNQWPLTLTLDGETIATFDPAAATVSGRVIIEGVPSLGWGKSGDTTFAGALESALSVTEHPYSYAQIMGYSGLAFRFRWGPRSEGWCPSVPVGEFPEEQAAVIWATGWQVQDEDNMDNEDDPHMERFAADMVASIDAGFPVVGYGPGRPALNVAVAFGYDNGGESFLWWDFFGGDTPVVLPATQTGPWIWILKSFNEPPSRRKQLLASLKIAVRNWHRPDEKLPPGKYYYLWGDVAYTAWAADIRKAATFDDEQQGPLFFANWWCFGILVDARNTAAVFLREYADAAGDDQAATHIRKAADLYQQEGQLLGAFYGTKDAFIGPWSGKSAEDWTDEVRQREFAAIAQAHSLDRQAIAELEAALAAME
ncbi:hypothetical protein LCGC14_0018730 [marine sediment metagenome]|uniref:Uncharacterized protein n=1 Tax=marine sediment metagenome TaxID=412755 RepID=A0A0F9YGN6_9ZZZZ